LESAGFECSEFGIMISSYFLATILSLVFGVYGAPASSGEFTVLSFNVAGLPEILNNNDVPGDKTTNTASIGTDFAAYDFDVIHVQEDFNYHATLYEYDDHPYRTATSGGAGIGSGLNTLANFDWVDFAREKWDDCSDASESDCLTPKGFTFMRVVVDEGVYIDFYNLHADAGTEDGDLEARQSNLQQVADYIDTWSIGNAVLVFGDTNSRYTRTGDNTRVFKTQNSLTDAWVELIEGGVYPTQGADASECDNPSTTNDCEVVDKVLYRGNRFITLDAIDFNYIGSEFLQDDGNILSDHNPILVNYTWSLSDSFRASALSGGPHGTWFNDLDDIPDSPKTSTITVAGGERLDSVAVELTDGTAFSHGGTGGTASSLTLAADEFWTSAELCTGEYDSHTRNFYIKATTSEGNSVTAGETTDDCVTFTAPVCLKIHLTCLNRIFRIRVLLRGH
jgi:hypothetical protein